MEPAAPRVQGTGGINVHEVPHTGYKEIGDTPLELHTVHAVEHLAAADQPGRSATPSSPHGAVSCERRRWRRAPTLLIVLDQGIICGSDRGIMMEGHLSVATIEALNKILRTCRNMRHVIGREPTPEEIAGRLGMPRETIRKLLGAPPAIRQH